MVITKGPSTATGYRLFHSHLVSAMGAVKLEHSDPARHRASLMQQLRQFWVDDHLCDVVLKSHDGTEHRAHTAVLSAASVFFKNLLGGSFLEAERVQQKQPVEIAASKAALSALLDYIYDGQPEVPVEVGLEVLRLAEAYDLPQLARAIEAGIRACLDSSVALQVLPEAHGLHSLRAKCEEKVVKAFETCSQHPDFGKLSATQLARILKREDLGVSREEAVVKAIFAWLKISKDRQSLLGVLLQHVHFQSLSFENLLRLGSTNTTLSGQSGDDLHREVEDALTDRNNEQSPGTLQLKRRHFQHWSPFLGAGAAGRVVLSAPCVSLCWHNGAIFASESECLPSSKTRILCWKPGNPETSVIQVPGIHELGSCARLSISAVGEMSVGDFRKRRLLRCENGSAHLVAENIDAEGLFYSPKGVLYVVSQGGHAVQKLVGSTLQTVIDSESLSEDMQFSTRSIFVTKEDVIYLLDNKNQNLRILRINTAEELEVVALGPKSTSIRSDLFVAEGGTIYFADIPQGKVWAFHPERAAFMEVLQCPNGLLPRALLVHDRSLYVSMLTPKVDGVPRSGKVYQYLLPPELQLE